MNLKNTNTIVDMPLCLFSTVKISERTTIIKNKYTFKVREIKGEGKTFENASKDLKNKYKEIDIVPEKKICVNKRIYAESYAGNRDVYKYNENNTSEKPKTVKKNNDINRKFTNQYKNVNYAYKSNLLRKQMNF